MKPTNQQKLTNQPLIPSPVKNSQNKDTKRKQFEENGYFIFKNILDQNHLESLREFSDEVLNQHDEDHFKVNRTTGSMALIDWAVVQKYKVLGDLVVHSKIKTALYEMGFTDPKFGHGRIISKPPKSPRLFWHEDGRFWNDPISYTTQPIQCFLMYYLSNTSRDNGCIRVIPGSHRKRHKLHELAHEKHHDDLKTYANPEDLQFQDVEGEIDVPLKAGDAIFGYANLFHASHSNNSDEKRTLLTMWYYPDFANLPERTQATIFSVENQKNWTEFNKKEKEFFSPFRVNYQGNAEIIEPEWRPGKDLK